MTYLLSHRHALCALWRTGSIWPTPIWWTKSLDSCRANLFPSQSWSSAGLRTWSRSVVISLQFFRVECFLQREYLERCDDRKSYNYLVGIPFFSASWSSSCLLSIGLNNPINLHIHTITVTLLKSLAFNIVCTIHSIGFVVLFSCIIHINISDVGNMSPLSPLSLHGFHAHHLSCSTVNIVFQGMG